MPPEDINFQAFFAAKMKDRGVSLKKLAEATGIAPAHLEALAHGRFEDLPSAPYVHGYLARIGKALDFNGEEWWMKIKKEGPVQNSGPADSLPSNRFLRQSSAKLVWAGVLVVVVIIYLAFQIPIIFGKPQLSLIFPAANPYPTTSSTLTLSGVERGADSLSLSSGSSGDSENITIASDGSWQKSVLLNNGLNTFQITAKKLLGGAAVITEEVVYQGPLTPVPAPSATSSATSTTAGSSTNAGATQTPATAPAP